MDFEDQILFFFSALGAFNGFFLSLYFAFFVKHKSKANYFLSALLFVVSVRVMKSVFLIYDPSISNLFIQVGLSACALIGPFLYLYVQTSVNEKKTAKWTWLIHVLPVIIIMIFIGYYYPYKQHRYLWQRSKLGYFGWTLFAQWFLYVLVSGIKAKGNFRKLLSKEKKADDLDIWLTTVVIGVGVIWLAYFTNGYTSYIVGALSFSFVFYLMLLLWVFKRRKAPAFFEKQVKYANKKITPKEAASMAAQLQQFFQEKELYKDPDLKLSEVADAIGVAPAYLSQYLNDNLQKSFSTFINAYRVDAAEKMLQANEILTLAAIGNECGFKSNSSFYSAFKKFKGITPGQFKKARQ